VESWRVRVDLLYITDYPLVLFRLCFLPCGPMQMLVAIIPRAFVKGNEESD